MQSKLITASFSPLHFHRHQICLSIASHSQTLHPSPVRRWVLSDPGSAGPCGVQLPPTGRASHVSPTRYWMPPMISRPLVPGAGNPRIILPPVVGFLGGCPEFLRLPGLLSLTVLIPNTTMRYAQILEATKSYFFSDNLLALHSWESRVFGNWGKESNSNIL